MKRKKQVLRFIVYLWDALFGGFHVDGNVRLGTETFPDALLDSGGTVVSGSE